MISILYQSSLKWFSTLETSHVGRCNLNYVALQQKSYFHELPLIAFDPSFVSEKERERKKERKGMRAQERKGQSLHLDPKHLNLQPFDY